MDVLVIILCGLGGIVVGSVISFFAAKALMGRKGW